MTLCHPAPQPARGRYADGFEPVAQRFAEQLRGGEETGAALSVYHRGEPVVDLWGGMADVASERPWQRDSRVVVFSVTKGFAAMAMHLLADRGRFDWDDPVAAHWPGFAAQDKSQITIRTLLNHRAGLAYLDEPLSLDDCLAPAHAEAVRRALEMQAPAWPPGQRQAYHAITFGLYVRELFERIAGEPLGPFLRRELFKPLGSDAWLGTPPSEDERQATLYPPSMGERALRMLGASLLAPTSAEAFMARAVLQRESIPKRVFSNPAAGRRGMVAYDDVRVRRACLAWASATASAGGVARAYLPFAAEGAFAGRRYLRTETLQPLYERQSWSQRDEVLFKPVGWSQGFLKEERHLFCPHSESFGHAGMGGSLGWCDPIERVTFGYVMNRIDWRIRSPRAVALCRTLYECEPLRRAAR